MVARGVGAVLNKRGRIPRAKSMEPEPPVRRPPNGTNPSRAIDDDGTGVTLGRKGTRIVVEGQNGPFL